MDPVIWLQYWFPLFGIAFAISSLIAASISTFIYDSSNKNEDISYIDQAQLKVIRRLSTYPYGFGPNNLDRAIKRGLDVSVAAIALLLLLPLLLVVATVVWAGDGKSPFFSSRRLGRGGQAFGCLKFRTMVVDSEASLERHLAQSEQARREWANTRKLDHDPRVTSIGRVLRKTSLDELPQLINVIRGEMSLVGPRPLNDYEQRYYGANLKKCYSVRPGVTGLWYVSGVSGASYNERVSTDLIYAERWRPTTDVMILLKSVPIYLRRQFMGSENHEGI